MTRLQRDWLIASALTAIALIQRLWGLGYPKGYIFDETYYAKNAFSLSRYGVEENVLTHNPDFIVHPPVGKWFIAIGIKLFGNNEFGWRFSAAVIGSLSVTVMFFTARKLFNSTFLIFALKAVLIVFSAYLLIRELRKKYAEYVPTFCLLFLITPFFVFTSRNFWNPSLVVAFNCIQIALFLHLVMLTVLLKPSEIYQFKA